MTVSRPPPGIDQASALGRAFILPYQAMIFLSASSNGWWTSARKSTNANGRISASVSRTARAQAARRPGQPFFLGKAGCADMLFGDRIDTDGPDADFVAFGFFGSRLPRFCPLAIRSPCVIHSDDRRAPSATHGDRTRYARQYEAVFDAAHRRSISSCDKLDANGPKAAASRHDQG